MSSDFPEDSKRTQSLKIRIKIPTRKRSSSARNKVETERLKVEVSTSIVVKTNFSLILHNTIACCHFRNHVETTKVLPKHQKIL